MSMPWEDFQQAEVGVTNAMPTIPAEAGGGNSSTPPWEDFKQANPHLSLVLNKNQTPQPEEKLNVLDSVLASPLAQELGTSLSDPKNLVNRAINATGGLFGHPDIVPLIGSTHLTEQGVQEGKPFFRPDFLDKVYTRDGMTPAPVVAPSMTDPSTIMGAIRNTPAQLIDSLTANPEQLAMGGSGAIANVARKLMAATMLYGGGKEVFNPDGTPGSRTTGALQAVLGGLVGAHGDPKIQGTEPVLSPENIQAATSPGLAELRMQADIPQIMKQLPERSQQLSEEAKVAAQAKLDASQALPRTAPEGFVAGNRGVVDAQDAFAVNDVIRPAGLLEAPKSMQPMQSPLPQEGSRPPFIAGATSAQGVEGVTPVTREMLQKAPDKQPDPNWQVTVQAPTDLGEGKQVPGYVQFDDVTGGENKWSLGAEKLKQAGYNVEDFSKLPQGKYTYKQAQELLKGNAGGGVPAERLASGEPMTTMGKMYSGVPLPENLKDITDKAILGAGKISSNIGEYIKSRPLRQTMAYMKDATSNLVGKNANEAASRVSGMLERATKMPDKRDSLNRQALTMVVEAEQQPTALAKMRDTLNASKDAKPADKAAALRAIAYAEKNLSMLKPVADEYSKLIENEARLEESAGRKIERRKGYVMHLAEDIGDATSFIHAREFNTLADRIAAGVPAGSLDAVELLRSRVARGQQVYVQSKVFVDNVRKLKDKDGQPIIGEYIKIPRGPGHADDVQVPNGYREVQMGFHKVPVLEPYADTLQALTAPSWFMQRALGRGMLEVRGVGKHIVLGFDTFHLGRLATFGASAKLGTGNAPSLRYSRGVTILDNTAEELTAKAKAGQLDMKDLPQMLADKKVLDLGVKTGYNIGRNIDAFNQHWTEHVPVSGTFQKWLFNTFQRGVMADVYVKAWDAYKAQMPKATDAAVARKLSSDLNTTFGTVGRQGWIRSRTGQDIMSMFFLAPQWTEGRIKSDVQGTLGVVKNIGQLATRKRPEVSMQTRVVGTTILAYLVANQAINMMSTGHSTFDNEKGHELDAFVPDVMSGGKGYWLNPSANATEVFHAMHSSLEKEGGDVWQAWLDFVGGRLSTVARPVATAVTGKQWGITGPDVLEPDGSKPGFGGPSGSAKLLGGLKNIVQAPIGVPQLGDTLMGNVDKNSEKALLSRFGFKVDNAQAPLTPAERKELGKKKKVVVR